MQASLRSRVLVLLGLLNAYLTVVSGFRLQSRTPYSLKDKHHVPRQWKEVGPAPARHIIQLQIGLKQGNFGELERHLYEVSDPSHARYGQHLSAAEVNDMIRPSQATLIEIEDWLHGCGISKDNLKYSPAKDWLRVVLPVNHAEQLLDTKYSIYEHEDGTRLIRTAQWSLPLHLHEHIENMQPTNSFLRPRPKNTHLRVLPTIVQADELPTSFVNSKQTVKDVCSVSKVTNECLRTLYGTIDYTPQSTSNNSVSIGNYLGEVANRSDISIFLAQFRSDATSSAQTFKVQTVNGATNRQSPDNSTELKAQLGVEGDLDAETVLGITYPTPLTVYNTAGSPPFMNDTATPTDTNEPYLEWLNFMLNQTTLPNVISNSYGDDEQTVPLSYATAVCRGFAQLGARGATVLFASGDQGVGTSGKCFKNDGTNSSTFLPGFPASCPYVTAMGGTREFSPEVAAYDTGTSFASGGGFSNYFPRPSYQDSVVSAYVTSLGNQYQGLYNTSGRAYPDISAQATKFVIVWNGTLLMVDGTSASTPTAASIITLVNDALIAAGKPVLGFMNPWLYSSGFKAFTDIVNGSSVGCNTTGFPAATGWDAVTGFGTPNFPKIRAAVVNEGQMLSPHGILGAMSTIVILLSIVSLI